MVIIGARGLAKELLVALQWDGEAADICLFDNVNTDTPDILYDRFKVIRSWDKLEEHFKTESPDFALGVGGQKARKFCAEKATSLGGKLRSIISKQALVGDFRVSIANGVCILAHAIITADIQIGEGTLINKAAIISHDVILGNYCEISPGAKILGKAKIGDRAEVGTNAVILPGVVVGCDCRIGAGAVVTKDVPDGHTVVGIPAKNIA